MKRLILIFILLTTICYSQTDTISIEIFGNKELYINETKKTFKFSETKYIETKEFFLKKNQYIILKLLDKNYKNNIYIGNNRKIMVFYRNNKVKINFYKSKNNAHIFDGKKIKKIIIFKPSKPKISKNIKC